MQEVSLLASLRRLLILELFNHGYHRVEQGHRYFTYVLKHILADGTEQKGILAPPLVNIPPYLSSLAAQPVHCKHTLP